jgi:hypothetical protein
MHACAGGDTRVKASDFALLLIDGLNGSGAVTAAD